MPVQFYHHGYQVALADGSANLRSVPTSGIVEIFLVILSGLKRIETSARQYGQSVMEKKDS